jgi:hypothetical protein
MPPGRVHSPVQISPGRDGSEFFGAYTITERGLGLIIRRGAHVRRQDGDASRLQASPMLAMLRGRVVLELPGSLSRMTYILGELQQSESPPGIRAEVFGSSGIGSPNASNPRDESRYMSDQFFASSFVLSMIRFQWLAPKPYCGTVLLTRFALFASQKAHILPNRAKDCRAMPLR